MRRTVGEVSPSGWAPKAKVEESMNGSLKRRGRRRSLRLKGRPATVGACVGVEGTGGAEMEWSMSRSFDRMGVGYKKQVC